LGLTELVFQKDSPNLLHLVRLRIISVALKIDLLLDARLPEYMVTALYPFLETKVLKQSAQIIESN